MKITTVSSDQNITELAQAVFALPTAKPEVNAQAAQALLEANPHLAGVKTVPLGTPIVVPEVPGLPPRATEAVPGGTFDELRTQAERALTYARTVFEEAAKDAAQEARNSLEVLRSREFRALAGTIDLNVDSLAKRVTEAAKDAEAQSKAELANLDALHGAVDELIGTLGGSSRTTPGRPKKSQSTRRAR